MEARLCLVKKITKCDKHFVSVDNGGEAVFCVFLVLYRFFVASNTKQCVSKQCSHLCFLRTG
jgi:hypothetical protein